MAKTVLKDVHEAKVTKLYFSVIISASINPCNRHIFYLIEMPFNAPVNRADPDQAALVRVYSVLSWTYDISDPTLVDLTSNIFVQT